MAEFYEETERLILRDWREEDYAAFFRHTNTPAVMEWLGGLLPPEKHQWMRDRLEGIGAITVSRSGFSSAKTMAVICPENCSGFAV